MFRAMITPICRSARLCITACGTLHPWCFRSVAWKREFLRFQVPSASRYNASWMHCTTSCNTQSNAPEDGRDHRPKHVELIGITNKPLFSHLVGVYIIYINDAPSKNVKFIKCNLCKWFLQTSLWVLRRRFWTRTVKFNIYFENLF